MASDGFRWLLMKGSIGSCQRDGTSCFNKGRGTGMLFGPDVCANFLRQEGFELLIRSHEPAHNGYDAFLNEGVPCMQVPSTAPPPLRYNWPYGDGHLCLTVFSASNYACHHTNRSAIVQIGAVGSVPPKGVQVAPSYPLMASDDL